MKLRVNSHAQCHILHNKKKHTYQIFVRYTPRTTLYESVLCLRTQTDRIFKRYKLTDNAYTCMHISCLIYNFVFGYVNYGLATIPAKIDKTHTKQFIWILHLFNVLQLKMEIEEEEVVAVVAAAVCWFFFSFLFYSCFASGAGLVLLSAYR